MFHLNLLIKFVKRNWDSQLGVSPATKARGNCITDFTTNACVFLSCFRSHRIKENIRILIAAIKRTATRISNLIADSSLSSFLSPENCSETSYFSGSKKAIGEVVESRWFPLKYWQTIKFLNCHHKAEWKAKEKLQYSHADAGSAWSDRTLHEECCWNDQGPH